MSPRPADRIHHIELQLAAARHLRWYPGTVEITDEEVTVAGWALSVWESQDQLCFLINGDDFDELEWPLPSPDLVPHFGELPHAVASRFRARHYRTAKRPLYRDGFVRFNVTSQFGEHAMSYRTAWYLPDPALEPPLPTPQQMERTIGSGDAFAFRIGGATAVRRFDEYLRQRFDRPLASFESVLDWGCGAGRLARYMPRPGPAMTGVDIDADNIAACTRLLPHARFMAIDLWPPAALPDASFDLVFGLSIVTHLDEAAQHAWLAELERLTRPGGLLLLSVQGQPQSALYRDAAGLRAAYQRGLHCAGHNPQLDGVLPDPDYYQDMRHTHDYILANWNRYFEVLDIVPALASHQDAVVLRRRAP